MVLPLIAALFVTYVVLIIIAFTLSPHLLGPQVPLDLSQFMLQATILWSGLSWLSVAVYIALVSESSDFTVETWSAFAVSVLMIYIGISGTFVASRYWMGVRTLLYLLLSFLALMYFMEIKSAAHLKAPSDRFAELFGWARGMLRQKMCERGREQERERERE